MGVSVGCGFQVRLPEARLRLPVEQVRLGCELACCGSEAASGGLCRVPVAGGAVGWRWLMACGGGRMSAATSALPPALADGPYVRGLACDGRAADNPWLVARVRASGQGWRQNKFDNVRRTGCDGKLTWTTRSSYLLSQRLSTQTL